MKVLDLFSGIGGLAYPAHKLGYEHLAFCEINTDCHKVLRRHFPGVEIITDVKEVNKNRHSFQPDVICGGFPCQDVSVAGRRAGLAGERSGLWFEALRIVTDYKPRIVVIENVPGLLSSNGGADFAVVLRGLVECGYGVAWRVFDSQYFGVAQRRRRVFIVGSLGDGSAAEILFEREGGGWNSAPSRQAGQRVAASLTAGVAASGGVNAPGRRREDDVNLAITHTLRAEADASEDGTGRGTPLVVVPPLALPLTASGRGVNKPGRRREDDINLVAFGGGREEREVSTSLSSRNERYDFETETLVAATLNSGGNNGGFRTEPGAHLVTAFQINASDEVRVSDIGYTLNTNGNATGRNSPTIAGNFGVRRLTPLECERLQGFPDEWTRYGDDGKEISDSARYRMLGNAITCSVGEWIFKRIKAL